MTPRGLEKVRISPLEVADEQGSAARTVSDVMRLDVDAVSPETSVYRAGRALVELDTPALPVVDRAGRVVGIFSEVDLVARLGPRRHRMRRALDPVGLGGHASPKRRHSRRWRARSRDAMEWRVISLSQEELGLPRRHLHGGTENGGVLPHQGRDEC
jgi:CBS domain-containing protein